LAEVNQPLVLGLDDVDRLFQFADLATDFFGLLRTWHEEGKNRDIWKKLRLVVVHSRDVYIPLEANRSPFNVGLAIELKPFTVQQVHTLAQRHGLNWSLEDSTKFVEFLGGQPYLVKKGLYHIWHQDVTLDQLLQTSPHEASIYSEHLQWQLWNLQNQPDLAEAFAQVLKQPMAVELNMMQVSRLQSMGLIYLRGDRPISSCRLYQEYFL
jgi:hypothetical protein